MGLNIEIQVQLGFTLLQKHAAMLGGGGGMYSSMKNWTGL